MSPHDRILISDEALRTAFESLPEDLRFHKTIESYFAALQKIGVDKRVDNVQNTISHLWEEASKYADFLEEMRSFEPLLKELGLRDHFIHSFNVFLLGYYIINKINRSTDQVGYYFGTSENTSNLIWLLASTFHDVAYAVEKTDDWLNKFFNNFLGVNPHFSLSISEVLTPVHADIMRMLSQYHKSSTPNIFDFSFDKMDWYYYNKLGEELAGKNHGVISALMLCHRMAIKEGFLCKPPKTAKRDRVRNRNQWDFLDHLRASHAISLHHISSIPVEFHRHPFAFVLILCDEIQDWGRGEMDKQRDFISLEKIDFQITNIPEINLKINASDERIKELKETLLMRLETKDKIKIFVNDVDFFDKQPLFLRY